MKSIDRYLAENSNDIGLLRENFIESLDKFDAIKEKLIKKIDNLTELKEFYNKNCPLNKKNNRQVYYKFLMVFLDKIKDLELTPEEEILIGEYAKYACYRAFDKEPNPEEIEYIYNISGFDCKSFFDYMGSVFQDGLMQDTGYQSVDFDFNSINYFNCIDGTIPKQFQDLYLKKLEKKPAINYFDKEHDPDGILKRRYIFYSEMIYKILMTIINYKYKAGEVTRLYYKNYIKDINKKLKNFDLTYFINSLLNEISTDKTLVHRLDSELVEMLIQIVKDETKSYFNNYKSVQYDYEFQEFKHLIAPSRKDTKSNIRMQSFAYANSNLMVITTMMDLEKVSTKDEILNILSNFYSKPEDITNIDDTLNLIPKPGLSEAEYEEN